MLGTLFGIAWLQMKNLPGNESLPSISVTLLHGLNACGAGVCLHRLIGYLSIKCQFADASFCDEMGATPWSKKGRTRVCEHFSDLAMVEKTAKVYKELLQFR